jgi:glycosyltransferase involved in cell wall biosynthesis
MNNKTILFLHNDGIPLQMYLIYYPCLSNSFYYRILLKRYKYILNNVDKCAFICRAGMKNCQNYFPFVKEKSFLIVNGITDLDETEKDNIESISKTKDTAVLKLVTVGSVSIRKGQRYIIKAIASLSPNERKKVHLDIVGNGPDYQICKQIVDKESLNENVKFWGAINNHEVYKVLANSDVFVLLSSNEGLPISIIEAMRIGLPIISTNVSGIPELIAYNNGLLVECDSRESQIYNIIKDNEKYDWKAMGQNSRRAYEEYYTFERMLNNYETMIDSLYQ